METFGQGAGTIPAGTEDSGRLADESLSRRLIRFLLSDPSPRPDRSYWLTRFVILRLLGVVYFFAFLSAATQIVPLIGAHGLLPASAYLDRIADHFGSRTNGFLEVPSLFWLNSSDGVLGGAAWAGVVLSLVVVAGFANGIIMAVLWAVYLSYVHIGQDWYGYGWEIQLSETGFLGIFLCPLLDPRPFPRLAPPPLVIGLFRWLIARIMIGAGLIKLRGDGCWRDLTCLYYHYETQPIPNPFSRMLHFMPRWFHKLGVVYNHLAELAAPWLAFWPTVARRIAGGVMLVLQIFLIFSGNLSFLNYLTIVPILACFDDALLRRVLPGRLSRMADRAATRARPSTPHTIAVWGLTALVAYLSIAPVRNLLSGHQVMNTSFNRLDLVNTYGAFGSVGKERDQIVIEGTDEALLTPETRWKEYAFICQPGDLARRPCVIAPYQPRIDWQIWFAAMSSPDRYPWTVHLAWKLLHNDSGALSLLAGNPFPGTPPRFVRMRLYRYAFAPPGDASGNWWTRTLRGDWLPPLSADDPRLLRFLTAYGWLDGTAPSPTIDAAP